MNRDKLIICVDDFGQHSYINQAVFHLSSLNKINATSVLIDGPALNDDDVNNLKNHKINYDMHIGLHINFTEFLSEEQNRNLIKGINQHLFISAFKYSEVDYYNEVKRQLNKFINLFGFYPDYFDGHQHIHAVKKFRNTLKVIYDEMNNTNIWIRVPSHPNMLNFHTKIINKLKAVYISAFCSGIDKLFNNKKYLLGIYSLSENDSFEKYFNSWLRISKNSNCKTVIMCHPAVDEIPNDKISKARKAEYNYLLTHTY